ncbi:class F sortase [Nocardioides coralli]|uniref:class F sortase n=1 Tax=Nocardioides coralli TaxID=2872154 RepID=UPI001CA464DC|nr:class F sortase [Nocardioides coralli]QZY27633.1 class F sortase [Nocardioides coralli]
MNDDVRSRRAGGVLTLLLALAGAALVVVGVVAWTGPAEREAPAAATTPTVGAEGGAVVPREQRVPREPGAPEELVLPRLGVRAPVVPVAAPGGVLTPPADAQVLGWWADGAEPGADRGSALVTGHTVSSGGGALDDLEELEAGDRVWLRNEGGRVDYEVRSTVVLGKGELARRAATLFDQEVDGRLVLITCEDWNGEEYLSNVVVTATPIA